MGKDEDIVQCGLEVQKEADRKVIEALRRAGGNLSLPHRVEHHFTSSSMEGAEELREWGIREGIEVSDIRSREREGQPYFYFDFIVPTIPQIDQIYADTSRFFLLAPKFSADYDGWGCDVVS